MKNKTNFNEFDLIEIHKYFKNLNKFFSKSFSLCCLLKKYFQQIIQCKPEFSFLRNCSKNQLFSILFWFIGSIGFLANLITIFYIIFIFQSPIKHFKILLAFSDLLISMYACSLLILKFYFGDEYVYKDIHWRNSVFCKFYRIFFHISSYISYEVLVLITFERFLSIKNPLKTNFLKRDNKKIACFCVCFFFSFFPAILYVFVLTVNLFFFFLPFFSKNNKFYLRKNQVFIRFALLY